MTISIRSQAPTALDRAADRRDAGVSPSAQLAAAAATLGDPAAPTIGVILVHGIGAQVRAETLLGWSRPIVQAVADWASSRPPEAVGDAAWSSDRVVRTEIDFDGSGMPLVMIRVPGTTEGTETFEPQNWVMTEARWAQDVAPPTLETMIDWCGPRGVIAAVITRIVERSMASMSHAKEEQLARAGADPGTPDRTSQAVAAAGARGVARATRGTMASLRDVAARVAPMTPDGRKSAGKALAQMGLSAIVSVVVTFGLIGYAVARAMAGLIPYKPVQDALARISLDLFLTTWWGDVYVLLDDPVQAANIRGQVARTIAALREVGCTRMVVVAHSGGTIVSYMALSDPALKDTAVADTFVTHGQAIQMGRAIHRAEGADPTSPGARIDPWLPLRVARWHDFHATHDPAPAGELEERMGSPGQGGPASFDDTEVWNRMSIADDHGEYFSNDEEFVDGLLTDIETAGRPGMPSRFAAGRDARIDRRQQRVFVLALWRRLMFVVPLIAIMTAFLTPSEGLIPELRDAARMIATLVPGTSELLASVHTVFPPPGDPVFITAAATLFAVLYMLAIIQAMLPIGRSEIWTGWRKLVFLVLDAGVFFIGLGVALAVRVRTEGDPRRGISTFADRLGDAPLAYAFIIVAVIFVALVFSGLRSRLDDLGRRQPTAVRSVIVVGALLVLLTALGGLILDANIRKVVAATAIALAMYQVLARIGAWRWLRWDESERLIARRRSKEVFRRRTIWAEFGALGTLAGVIAIAIGLGLADVLRTGTIAVAGLVAVLVVADVVARKPATAPRPPPDSVRVIPPAPTSGVPQILEPVERGATVS